jgi:hypothetical protein
MNQAGSRRHDALLALTFFHRHVLELFRAECARHSRSAHSGEAALADGRA